MYPWASSMLRVQLLMCLKRSGPRCIPPYQRVTTTSTLRASIIYTTTTRSSSSSGSSSGSSSSSSSSSITKTNWLTGISTDTLHLLRVEFGVSYWFNRWHHWTYVCCLSVTLVIHAYTVSHWNAICTVQYSHVRCALSLQIAELIVEFVAQFG